ncbi:L-serine dehydratase [Natranaerovirga pectinivora]|uniref:L-serine deaminase n=1 Tax=Natranaerovirga pectinivora TaxID=682400 RepID=A0A4R3MH34_9FIRM|nr:L-serine ammonia-lyase, iron-sulfur-dependent subunit beta [Natranaerovirga pectinivora]TCT11677.1 L-serine dehydratase [Natranaerovirga pectinivora]
MEEYSIFDMIGPIMVGPSSSHTAGAAKIAYIGYKILGEEVMEVTFTLHGSFASTYKGHGTDKALVGGIMGLLPDDENLKHAFDLAKEKNIVIGFKEGDLGNVHPNTVRIDLTGVTNKKINIIGSSIGAGKIKIINIGNIDIDFTGDYTTLITHHIDQPGIIAKITTILANSNINIAFMKVYRPSKGEMAVMLLETDENIPHSVIEEINKIEKMNSVQLIEKITG